MGGFGYCSGHREDRGMDNAYNVSPGAVMIAATSGQRHLTKSIKAFVNQNQVHTSIGIVKFKYIFIGWNTISISLFPNGQGDEFPVFSP